MATMSGPALRLYVCLFLMGNQHSAPTIEIPAYILEDWTGLSESSVRKAAKELSDAGLVVLSSGAHGTSRYTLNDPRTIHEAGERQEPETKKTPARTVKLFAGDALPAPSKFHGVYRCPLQPGRSSRTKREIRSKAKKAAEQPTPAPFSPPTGAELFGDNHHPVPCLPMSTYVPNMDTVRKNHGTESHKSFCFQSDSVRLLKDSEEGSLRVASSELLPAPETERKTGVKKAKMQKAIPEQEVREESVQNNLGAAFAKNETSQNSEPVPRWFKEPVVLRLMEKFGAHLSHSPDATNPGVPYDEWMRSEVLKQLGLGLPYWRKSPREWNQRQNKPEATGARVRR